MLTYETMAGDTIGNTFKQMVIMANNNGQTVQCEFNGQTIVANPDDDAEQLYDAWDKERERKRQEWLASPEGLAYQKKQAEEQRKLEQSIERGESDFDIIDQDAWEEGLSNNQDGYGRAIFRFASRWAADMEEKMLAGAKLADIANQSSIDADEEGITGFMYGAAVSILAKVWKHGEELRRWHNKDTQIGNEGDEANESGGVLNPALLNVE